MSGTAIVIGVGARNGLGAALASRFAREGLEVVLVGRTAERLRLVAEDIRAAGGHAETIVADITREHDIASLFASPALRETLELVVYNAGSNARIQTLEITSADFESMWRQNALGGLLVGQEAIRVMRPRGKGTLIFTGATASVRSRPPFVAFAAAKAALRAVAQGLAREFGPEGIHVAHVIIDGIIGGDFARKTFPEFVKTRGEGGLLDLDEIAETYWSLHQQGRSAWTHELDVRPFSETF